MDRKIKEEEICEVCCCHGELLQLLDATFGLLNTKCSEFQEKKAEELKERLEVLREKWLLLSLNVTPRMHTLLNHSPDMLMALKGFLHMSEERIE